LHGLLKLKPPSKAYFRFLEELYKDHAFPVFRLLLQLAIIKLCVLSKKENNIDFLYLPLASNVSKSKVD
jgi:hypothetical protein